MRNSENYFERGRFCRLVATLVIPFQVGCGTLQTGSSLAQQVRNRPLPASESERTEECTRLRLAMEHEQDVFSQHAVFARGFVAIYNRVRLEESLTVLQSRATAARCSDGLRYAYCGWHPLCWTDKPGWFADRRN